MSRTGKIAGGGSSDSTLAAPLNGMFPALFATMTLWIPDDQPTTFTFSGMDDKTVYTFEVFASIKANAGQAVPSLYVLKGAGTVSGQLDAANNASRVASFPNLVSSKGQLTLTVQPAPGASNHPYINAVRILRQAGTPAASAH